MLFYKPGICTERATVLGREADVPGWGLLARESPDDQLHFPEVRLEIVRKEFAHYSPKLQAT